MPKFRHLLAIFFFILHSFGQQTVPKNQRIDCDPVPGDNQQRCLSHGCVYDTTGFDPSNPTVPLCYYPNNTGYNYQSGINPIILKKSLTSVKNPYGTDFDQLTFTYQQIGAGLHITIAPKGVNRYRPPVPINASPNLVSSDKFNLKTNNQGIFSFQVQRQSTGVNIWDTSIGGLLFADKFIQIATFLPNNVIYGFGENIHQHIQHNLTKYTTWGMYSRDQAPNSKDPNTQNLYGTHPFYLGLERDGSAHGVFIFNSNAQEVTTGPAPHLVYRTIGGQLEFFFFPGPTPEEVIQQYEQVIGTPFLPAYWALGFQLCRWGYENLTMLQEAVQRTMDAGVPLDVPFADIDYMDDYRDFSLDPVKWVNFPNYTKWLHDNGMHLTLIFDPAIEVDYYTFQRGMQNFNASFIEWPRYDLVPHDVEDIYPLTKGTKIMLGNVWPQRNTAFPDFLDTTNNTRDWWANEYVIFHNTKVPFDGIWIDMNEPSNFATGIYYENTTAAPMIREKRSDMRLVQNKAEGTQYLKCPDEGPDSEWDNPAYQTTNVYQWGSNSYLCTKTLCMIGATMNGQERFYDTKNLYGWSEIRATSNALKVTTGKRGEVISRSTFPSSGHYGGHWLGDNTARWEDLQTSIIGAQEFNMFGIPFVGSDICGFNGNTNEELCLRWQQMGAFHSFSRNHNTKGAKLQDPAQWPTVAAAARKANLFRYRHLPYLFSLHFSASLKGGTVVRPVFFEFPADEDTHNLSHQFLWGPAMMIIPVIYQGATTVDGYLPSGAIWYSLYDSFYGTKFESGHQTFTAPWEYLIPVFVRGGYILPRQRPNTTTVFSRQNELQLLVALDSNLKAGGELYWDDGETIVPNDDFSKHNYHHFLYNFTLTSQTATLTINQDHVATGVPLKTLDNIEILGYPYQPNLKSANLNGKPIAIDMKSSSYSPFTRFLNITTTGLVDLNSGGPTWTLTWNNLNTKKFWDKLHKNSAKNDI